MVCFDYIRPATKKDLRKYPHGEDILKYFPGKVFFGSLADKLGLSTENYLGLIVSGLTSTPNSPLADLGKRLARFLGSVLPPRFPQTDG